MSPEREKIGTAIILGERADNLAMAGPIPAAIKARFLEAQADAEGQGIRSHVISRRDIPAIAKLVEIRTTAK